jgi:hypothetical protein
MHYEKPLVIDLNNAARGAGPLLCKNGGAASNALESCATGTSADWTCSGGIGPTGSGGICAGGFSPGLDNDCVSGTGVSGGFCAVGPSGIPEPYGCNVGPSFV